MVVLDKYGLSFYSENLVAHARIDASKAVEQMKEVVNTIKKFKQKLTLIR